MYYIITYNPYTIHDNLFNCGLLGVSVVWVGCFHCEYGNLWNCSRRQAGRQPGDAQQEVLFPQDCLNTLYWPHWLNCTTTTLCRYYRQHCTLDFGSYTKDLSAICADLSSVFILDNSPGAYRAYPGINHKKRFWPIFTLFVNVQTMRSRSSLGSTIQATLLYSISCQSLTLSGFRHCINHCHH